MPRLNAAPALRAPDLGTGMGAIALAIQERRDVDMHACDNSANVWLSPRPIAARWVYPFPPLMIGFSALTSAFYHRREPAYIDSEDPHRPSACSHGALVAPDHGLGDLQAIVERAPAHLYRHGWLLLEHGYDQGMATRELLTNRGFEQVRTRRDLGGNERVSWGRLPVNEAD